MLGTIIESALSSVGVTPDRVTAWLGKPCGCKERKEKLDRLGWWALQTLSPGGRKNPERMQGIIGLWINENPNRSKEPSNANDV